MYLLLIIITLHIVDIKSLPPPIAGCLIYGKGVNQADADNILELHNQLRNSINAGTVPDQPKGNLINLWYDEMLGLNADTIANSCDTIPFRVKDERFETGINSFEEEVEDEDNLTPNWDLAVNSWVNEKNNYKFGPYSVNAHINVSNYLQMVWSTTLYIGCGFSVLTSPANPQLTKYYICAYGPRGNIPGYVPYILFDEANSPKQPAAVNIPKNSYVFDSPSDKDQANDDFDILGVDDDDYLNEEIKKPEMEQSAKIISKNADEVQVNDDFDIFGGDADDYLNEEIKKPQQEDSLKKSAKMISKKADEVNDDFDIFGGDADHYLNEEIKRPQQENSLKKSAKMISKKADEVNDDFDIFGVDDDDYLNKEIKKPQQENYLKQSAKMISKNVGFDVLGATNYNTEEQLAKNNSSLEGQHNVVLDILGATNYNTELLLPKNNSVVVLNSSLDEGQHNVVLDIPSTDDDDYSSDWIKEIKKAQDET